MGVFVQKADRTVGPVRKESEDCCKTPEEINLVRRIDQLTHELSQSLRTIEVTVDNINNQLLPLVQEVESKGTTEKQEPQGWLEKHLDFLFTIYQQSVRVHGSIRRLHKEIKTEESQ